MKRIIGTLGTILAGVFLAFGGTQMVHAQEAADLEVSYSTSYGNTFLNGTDNSYDSAGILATGEVLTIQSQEMMQGLYIKWDRIPGEYTILVGEQGITGGTEGFLHEYIELPENTTSVSIQADHEIRICDIDVYGAGELPQQVQIWQPSCENADVLVFATHSDDEILFLGATLAQYAGIQKLNVQMAYMCEFNSTAPIREHEKLDGIWHCGVRNYPVCGDFLDDVGSLKEDGARQVYDLNALEGFVTETIRRFRPLVVVSQDLRGEYGHGAHIVFAEAIKNAVDQSMNEDYFSEQLQTYEAYDVPKTYFHLYGENQIQLDVQDPIEEFGGKTIFEVVSEAYQYHKSQLWCAFYVSDGEYRLEKKYKGYKYGIRDFGLYRSTVGADTQGNNMMENLKSYGQIAAEEEAKRLEEEKKRQELERQEAEKQEASQAKKTQKENKKSPIGVIIKIILLLICVFVLGIVLRYLQVEMRRRRRRKRRNKYRNKR